MRGPGEMHAGDHSFSLPLGLCWANDCPSKLLPESRSPPGKISLQLGITEGGGGPALHSSMQGLRGLGSDFEIPILVLWLTFSVLANEILASCLKGPAAHSRCSTNDSYFPSSSGTTVRDEIAFPEAWRSV